LEWYTFAFVSLCWQHLKALW